jgi:hypothetical protein
VIVAGWGACLIPFAFAPAAATLVCFAVGGLIYSPFTALTYALFQSITTAANFPSVLAARSVALVVAAPSAWRSAARSSRALAPAGR